MLKVATTLLTAVTVLWHAVMGCGTCRHCDRPLTSVATAACSEVPANDVTCRCETCYRHCACYAPIGSWTPTAELAVHNDDSEHCAACEAGHLPFHSHPCDADCSFHAAKIVAIPDTLSPNTTVTWLGVEDLQKPVAEGLRSYPARQVGQRPPQLRSHLALRVLLI